MMYTEEQVNLMIKMEYRKTTSTGHTWAVTKKGWLNETSGLVWKFTDEPGNFTFDEATEKFGKTLPTMEEWEIADEHGVLEVLELEGKYYWSSSFVPTSEKYAWLFVSGVGAGTTSYKTHATPVRLIVR